MNILIQQIAAYFLSSVENRILQNARLTQMFYLADWKSCLVRNEQITDIRWEINEFGPFSTEVLKTIVHNRNYFSINRESSSVINLITAPITLSNTPIDTSSLDLDTRQVLDFVLKQTEELDFQPFISLIYSTYPVFRSKRFSVLNLKALSKEYKASRFWNKKSSSFEL